MHSSKHSVNTIILTHDRYMLYHGFSFMDEHLTEWFDMICHGTNNRNDILGRLCSQTTVRSIIYSSIALSKLACNWLRSRSSMLESWQGEICNELILTPSLIAKILAARIIQLCITNQELHVNTSTSIQINLTCPSMHQTYS